MHELNLSVLVGPQYPDLIENLLLPEYDHRRKVCVHSQFGHTLLFTGSSPHGLEDEPVNHKA